MSAYKRAVFISYAWKDDQRNSLSANRQILRVVRGNCMWDVVPALMHGFRVVINLEEC